MTDGAFTKDVDYFLVKLISVMDEGMQSWRPPDAFVAALQVCLNMGAQKAAKGGMLDRFKAAIAWANKDQPPPQEIGN